ncbi:unannotated protein [freshwater metagenome]|jgi:kynurenine formamidase|uniref:Unannotated protein n=1 Tax=freshwater metagenome TaxID=449393 RepID=A0A6J6WBL7_9ZZZZ|nr:cyclase family protein [Actinomycetota bacterium]
MSLPPHLQELSARVSNWGRWGADDRRGTLNLIDNAAVHRGLAAARQGRTFLLSLPYDENGIQNGAVPGRDNPKRAMHMINVPYTGDPTNFCTSDDSVSMGVQCSTHWDTLAHVGYEGLLYNGVSDSTIDENGSHQHGVETFGPIVSRGVLLDVARVHGVDFLPGGYPITGDDLEAACALGGITMAPGDIACVRTGNQYHLASGDKTRYTMEHPGLSTKSIQWARDTDIAAIATDTMAFECWPCEDPNVLLPVHMIHLRDMGLIQGQNWVLDELAADCASDGQYDFLLSASPLPLTRSLGGPIAPTAIK